MQFIVKRDILLKSLNFVQGVVEKKNTLPILSNVLLQLKDKRLSIVATDLDIVFHDEIADVKILKEGSTTTSAAILYDILRKISSNSELNFELKTENKISLKSDNSDFNLLCLPTDNFPTFADEFEDSEISLNNKKFLKLLNKTKIAISNDDTRHYLNGIFLHLTEGHGRNFLTGVATDSHRLSSSSVEVENPVNFSSLILPRKTVFQLCALLAETSDKLSMQTSENKIKFNLGKIKLISKVIDGKFPDYKKVVPVDNKKTLIVPSKEFINSIERVTSVSLDRKEGVKLVINKDDIQLSVNSANSGDGNETIKANFNSENLNISFNSKYLVDIASEKYNEAHLASFMTVFMMRPITVDELSGFRNALKELSIKVDLSDFNTIDIVGTGGDGKDTFNISTLTSFIVAGTGQKVAKHGNYSVSSQSGSSDMLANFGYEFTNNQSILKTHLEKANICFLHAPKFHPAMKAVGPTRKALALKTFFNMLGPLVNPSSPKNQLLGTFNLEIARLYNYILQEEDTNYSIIHSLDGYDEISLTSGFKLFTKNGEQIVNPEDLGQKRIQQAAIFGGNSVSDAAKIFTTIIEGNGTEAQNNVVLTNAAFALKTVDQTKNFEAAFIEAKESLFSLRAKQTLEKLVSI